MPTNLTYHSQDDNNNAADSTPQGILRCTFFYHEAAAGRAVTRCQPPTAAGGHTPPPFPHTVMARTRARPCCFDAARWQHTQLQPAGGRAPPGGPSTYCWPPARPADKRERERQPRRSNPPMGQKPGQNDQPHAHKAGTHTPQHPTCAHLSKTGVTC